MSNRVFEDQYSDGTTVDGNRLQRTLDDVQERINSIPRGDIRPRYIQQVMQLGWMPELSVPLFFEYPFQSIYNDTGSILGGDTTPVVNDRRTKGTYNPSVVHLAGGDQRVFYFQERNLQGGRYPRPCQRRHHHLRVL